MLRIVPSFEFRRRASAAMKPVLSALVIIALILTLPSLIQTMVIDATDSDPENISVNLMYRLMQITENTSLTPAEIEAAVTAAMDVSTAELMAFYAEKGPLLAAMSLAVLLLMPALNLGMNSAALLALRRQPFTPGIVLSRARYFLKALGLDLLLSLRVFVWMLPGAALTIVTVLMPESLMIPCMLAGFAAMVVLGVRAAYLYRLAMFFQADDPDLRLRDCISRSAQVMKGRRMELFFLEISFIGWVLLISLGQSLVAGFFGAVVATTLGMFANLFLTVYTTCAIAAFYQEYAVGPLASPAMEKDDVLAGDEES